MVLISFVQTRRMNNDNNIKKLINVITNNIKFI